jgi:hypothetical protein
VTEPIDVSIDYLPGRVDESARVIPLGDDLYRLELPPMWTLRIDLQGGRDALRPRAGERRRLPDCGDVIEAREIAPGLLRFVRVVECMFTSCWTIYLPRDSDFDPQRDLREHADPRAGGGAAPGDAV